MDKLAFFLELANVHCLRAHVGGILAYADKYRRLANAQKQERERSIDGERESGGMKVGGGDKLSNLFCSPLTAHLPLMHELSRSLQA